MSRTNWTNKARQEMIEELDLFKDEEDFTEKDVENIVAVHGTINELSRAEKRIITEEMKHKYGFITKKELHKRLFNITGK